MYMKPVILTTLMLTFTVCGAYWIWAHCHNSETCEDLPRDVLTPLKWKPGTRVSYHINTSYRPGTDLPPIAANVNSAAGLWNAATYNGNDIPEFNLYYAGTTTRKPAMNGTLEGVRDQWNVVGWTHQLHGTQFGAQVWTWRDPIDNTKIVEQDCGLNYYLDWDDHGDTSSTELCVKNVMAHEFGHFVHLNDAPENVCNVTYKEYTMCCKTKPDEHKKESLECEDIWALYKTYNP